MLEFETLNECLIECVKAAGGSKSVQPRDEADQIRREMLEMGKSLQAALARLEAVDARQPLRVA
jgi:hypothetical protein